jgi:hypothetical protein
MTIERSGFMAILLAAMAVAACGGGKKGGTTTPVENGEGGGGGESRPDPGDTMVKPETADEIQRAFERKRASVSRCLSLAIDAKELPKSARGRITLNVTVLPGGKVGEIKVTQSSLESKVLTDCVISKVHEVLFPEVPQAYPTSYTYAFEAM